MGLLIRVTLFMCVLNWRWAQAVILEGDQPCLGLLNLMENLPTAFALSPTDWKQNNLAFRLLSCFDCQIQYITFTNNTQPSHWFLPSAEFITFTVWGSSWTCLDWGRIVVDCYQPRSFISFFYVSGKWLLILPPPWLCCVWLRASYHRTTTFVVCYRNFSRASAP